MGQRDSWRLRAVEVVGEVAVEVVWASFMALEKERRVSSRSEKPEGGALREEWVRMGGMVVVGVAG